MKFSSTLLRAVGAAALAAMLASCGGGNGLVAFVPARILAFGDQSSVITVDGDKYTINALNTDGTVDCVSNPIWIQVLASGYGMVFPECVGTSTGAPPTSRILAQAGAKAAGTDEVDLAQQITRQLELSVVDGGGITSNDLVTVFIGVNDVVAAYEGYEAGANRSDVQAQAEAAGVAIATQIARIVDAGGKVIVATVPDVGVTPYGRSKDAAGAALLSFLTLRVNNQFLLALQNSGYNDGRKIGMIEINPYLITVIGNPPAYGYLNVTDAACLPADLLSCTTNTLQTNTDGTNAGAFTWLWASELQMSPGGHRQLGNLASSRAHNQPF
jgi:phospholipase/lecithinase/hemolysin